MAEARIWSKPTVYSYFFDRKRGAPHPLASSSERREGFRGEKNHPYITNVTPARARCTFTATTCGGGHFAGTHTAVLKYHRRAERGVCAV